MIKITDKIVIYDNPDLLEVSGIELSASDISPYIGSRKKLRIMADRFHFNAPITVPMGDVMLVARHVLGGDAAILNVSGTNGLDAPSTPKPTPVNAKSPAPNGENGRDVGKPGGTITLVAMRVEGALSLSSNGGKGGRGQPGGNAASGTPPNPDNVDNKTGGDGGPAGPIGAAGASRDSGNGGVIKLFVNQGGETIKSSVMGGPVVPAVSHGNAGKPGAAGKGGVEWECYTICDRPSATSPATLAASAVTSDAAQDLPGTPEVLRCYQSCRKTGRRKPNGTAGAPSKAITAPPVAGKAGQDGVLETGDLSAHGAEVPLRGLRLLMLEAEMLHIRATATASDMDTQDEMLSASNIAGFVFVACLGSKNPAVVEIGNRASALMHRISTGSPPEGTRGQEVPLTPLPVLMESLRISLESRWRGLAYIEPLKEDTRTEAAVSLAIKEVTGQAAVMRSEGNTRLAELAARRQVVVDTVDQLSSSFHVVWQEVNEANKAFLEEVARKNPCADFLNVVIVVATVAVTVISAGSAAAGAIAAGSEILAYIDRDETRKATYEAEIKKAGGLKTRLDGYAKGAQDLAKNAQKLKELLGGDALTPPQDHVRVGMTREDFNKMIEPYRGMGATEELKRRMDRFFSLTETRNSLLIEHDQIVVETAATRAGMVKAQEQADDLVDREGAALIDSTIDAYEAALWLDLEVGKRLMGHLQAANKAFEYLALRPRPMHLQTTRGDNLESEFSRLVHDIAMHRQDQLSWESVCEITISNATHPETFSAFLKGDEAFVSLMPEHVPPAQKGRWDERAFAVGIKINGIKASSAKPVALTARMISCGIAWFKTQSGEPVSMRTPRRDTDNIPVTTALDLVKVRESRNMIGTEKATVMASPYGIWNVRMPGISALLKRSSAAEQKELLGRFSLTFCFIGETRLSDKLSALMTTRRQELLPRLPRVRLDPLESIDMVDRAYEEEERISVVTDLQETWRGSPMETAALVRLVEDMTHVEVIYPETEDPKTKATVDAN
ncbi:hypothetical protein [Paracoccus sp. ME4]|uniref:hypothetical protein n=1 Tax=Paracoccus sp. ME4 TaxID=3138066 RepID=UPI00398B3300